MTPFSDEYIRHFTKMGAWEEETLWSRFCRNVAATPDRLALVDDPRKVEDSGFTENCRLTYSALADRVERVASVLYANGLRQGDIIVVQMPNIAEFIILYLAAARLGLIVSPVAVQFREKEIRDVLSIVHPKAIVTINSYRGVTLADMWLSLPTLDVPVLAWGGEAPSGAVSLDQLLDETPAAAVPDGVVSPNSVFTICWTSGTEAQPKAVPRTYNNWLATAKGISDGAGMHTGDHLLNPFPAINVASLGGLVLPWILTGGRLVLHMPFNLDVFVSQIATEEVSYSVVAPALLTRLLKTPDAFDGGMLKSIRALGTGSAPPDPWTMSEFQQRYGISITNFFGSNEGVSLCAADWDIPDPAQRAVYFPRAGRDEYKWKNRVSNWSRTRLVDYESSEEITEVGVPGELAIFGPTVFPGYYTDQGLDRRCFTDDGYLLTGDTFEIAAEGDDPRYYRFVGRSKEILIRGGMNISPVEVESLLAAHKDIVEVAIAGIPDTEMGERIGAFLVVRDGSHLTKEELSAFLADQGLARYKHPEVIVEMEALPRSPLNKVLRRELPAYATKEPFQQAAAQ